MTARAVAHHTARAAVRKESPMKKTVTFVALMLTLAVALATPASSRDWIETPFVDAAERMLATMPADFYQIAPAAAQQQMENAKPFVLDVREVKEMTNGKIAGSVNIPIRELPKSLAQLPESKTAPIIVYCKIGYRGGIAMTLLRVWGYTNVRSIQGGLDGWEKAGLPVVDKAS
jgi:rhodanese-related sulfurtransferase